MLSTKNFSPEQKQAVRDILKKKVMCITSDCGFGKTVVGLTSFAMIKKKYPETKALVVCTPEGVKGTWTKEHDKWEQLKHLNVVPLVGSPDKRLKLLKQDADVFVISYHSLKWLVQNNKHTFDFIFADEGDCLKGSSSKWRSYLEKLSATSTWRVISTATPKAREEDDYWGLCKYLDGGKALGETIGEFRARYMTSFTVGRATIYKIRKSSITELESKIEHLFFNYDKSDEATIPIKTITVNFDLSDDSLEKYRTLQQKQMIGSLVDLGEDEEPLGSLQISGKLDQLSHGFLYVDDNLRISLEDLENASSANELLRQTTQRTVVDVFDDRIKALNQLVTKIKKKHGDTPIVICYHHKHAKTQILSMFPNALTDTDEDFVNKWNSGKYPYLLLQYGRSSKSLNLQQGGHIMVFYSPTWKWVDDYQIVRRLARQGQPEPVVYVYRLYARGTVDDMKAKRLDERFMGHTRFQKKIIRELSK